MTRIPKQWFLIQPRAVLQQQSPHREHIPLISHPGYQQSNRLRQRFLNLFGYLFGYLFGGRVFIDTQVSISELMPLPHQQFRKNLSKQVMYAGHLQIEVDSHLLHKPQQKYAVISATRTEIWLA